MARTKARREGPSLTYDGASFCIIGTQITGEITQEICHVSSDIVTPLARGPGHYLTALRGLEAACRKSYQALSIHSNHQLLQPTETEASYHEIRGVNEALRVAKVGKMSHKQKQGKMSYRFCAS